MLWHPALLACLVINFVCVVFIYTDNGALVRDSGAAVLLALLPHHPGQEAHPVSTCACALSVSFPFVALVGLAVDVAVSVCLMELNVSSISLTIPQLIQVQVLHAHGGGGGALRPPVLLAQPHHRPQQPPHLLAILNSAPVSLHRHPHHARQVSIDLVRNVYCVVGWASVCSSCHFVKEKFIFPCQRTNNET